MRVLGVVLDPFKLVLGKLLRVHYVQIYKSCLSNYVKVFHLDAKIRFLFALFGFYYKKRL